MTVEQGRLIDFVGERGARLLGSHRHQGTDSQRPANRADHRRQRDDNNSQRHNDIPVWIRRRNTYS